MHDSRAIDQPIVETLEKNYMPYAMSVIVSRAIPEIDGFKPSHRKLLYTMYNMGLLKAQKTKSSNVVGQTMKLNPHSDMSIYETMVRLTRANEALLHPFIDSKGNFGKRYSRDMAFAAPRYTEVKLDQLCEELFRDIDKNSVNFVDNYDATMKEPVLLPTTFPNVLVNASQGIAVGMASNMAPFNLKEVCDAVRLVLKNPEADIMSVMQAPDFSSGGFLILEEKTMRDIFRTGRGSFKLRGRWQYDKKNNCVEITEIPYTTTVEAIMDAIVDLVKDGKIRDISDVRDETDLGGLKLTLDLKRGSWSPQDVETLMNKLYKLTPLEESFGCNFNILIDGTPRVLGVRNIIDEWIRFRSGVIARRTEFERKRYADRLHLLLGLKIILLDIDKAIRIIRDTEKEAEVVPNLIAGFGVDAIQAEYIAEIRLRQLNREYLLRRLEEVEDLEKAIADCEAILGDQKRVYKIIDKELSDVTKKHGRPRRTEILHDEHVEVVTQEHFIEDYNLKIFLTDHGYLKKIPLTGLRNNPEQKLKEDDALIGEFDGRNKSDLLLFTNQHNCYKLKTWELPEHKASSLGEYLPNALELQPDEQVRYLVITDNYSGCMLFAFENGKASKIEVSSYATKTNRKKLQNAYANASPLCHMEFLAEDDEFVAYSSIDKVLVFSTSNINPKTTRDAQGVQVMNSKKGSIMTRMKRLSRAELTDPDYYRTKNIPATGYYKKEDDVCSQMSFIEGSDDEN